MTQPSPRETASRRPLIFVLVLVLAASGGILLGLGRDNGAAVQDSTPAPPGGASEQIRELGEALARRDPADPTALGQADAPVVLVAYSDYQCPFCGRWVEQTQPELVERYVEQGVLRIEWREFPYLGEASWQLAVGARAAAEQDLFWAFHERVYRERENLDGAGEDLRDRMVELAVEVGADPERFAADLDREDLSAAVEADFAEGQSLGVSGTPAFLVNGAPVMGAQPLEVFTSAVEAALAEAGE
jgi:protein-disulfide isomerase